MKGFRLVLAMALVTGACFGEDGPAKADSTLEIVQFKAPAGWQAGITPWHYFLAQGPVVLRYLRLLIVPYGFTVDPDIRVPAVWLGLAAWVVVVSGPSVPM